MFMFVYCTQGYADLYILLHFLAFVCWFVIHTVIIYYITYIHDYNKLNIMCKVDSSEICYIQKPYCCTQILAGSFGCGPQCKMN